MGSFESQSISFEAGRVVRRRKQQFRVLVWHAWKSLYYYIRTLRIGKENWHFYLLGSKRSSQYQEKRSWIRLVCNFRLTLSLICATNECVMNSFYFQFGSESWSCLQLSLRSSRKALVSVRRPQEPLQGRLHHVFS